jgi:hypothetical protein
LHAVPLADLVLQPLGLLLQRRRAVGDPLLQGLIQVLQRLFTRVQLPQHGGLLDEASLQFCMQPLDFVLAAARPQGDLDGAQQRARMERTFQQCDLSHGGSPPLQVLPQGLRGRGAGSQEHQGHIGPDRLPLQGLDQPVEGLRGQRFFGDEAGCSPVQRGAKLLHPVADMRLNPHRV